MTEAAHSSVLDRLFSGEGEMCALMRSHDWAQTPLGAVEQWPQSLRTTVSILLNSRYPMVTFWGTQLVKLYNDAYRPVLGYSKHPNALGRPASEIWPEIWDTIGPMLNQVITTGKATWSDNLQLFMRRSGYLEETYFTFSYSSIRDETGGVGGIFCACNETTQQILGERRLRTLRDLAAQTGETQTAEAACQIALKTLANNPVDIPFALLYIIDAEGKQAHLAGTIGLEPDTPESPRSVELSQPAQSSPWPLARVAHTARVERVEDVIDRFGALAVGPWEEPPHTALVVPVASPGQVQPTGMLVAGISSRRALDDDYQGFLELVAAQIASAIADARAYEAERQRAEALAELDRAKTLFFTNISHEFRTPLTLMLAPAEEALADTVEPLPPLQRDRIEIVQRNGLRLLKLVNTLLDFSRIEAGRIQAVYEPTDLATFTAELASTFRSLVESAGLSLVVECSPLSQAIYIDREMWEKIVLNLLSNAFKFTFTGTITVRLQGFPDHIELAVADTGIGIPVDEIPRLFERFHRVKEAQSRSFEGSGIGLSLVEELVKLHGGSVCVTSELGQGSCFIVSIPTGFAHLPSERIGASRTLVSTAIGATPYVEEARRWLPEEGNREWGMGGVVSSPSSLQQGLGRVFTPGDPPQPPLLRGENLLKVPLFKGDGENLLKVPLFKGDLGGSEPDEEVCASSVASPRILLVDDNADMRAYVTRLLGQRYEVEAVADGMAALKSLRQRLPDLILTDVMMPRLDGFGLLRELRADPKTRELPIILLSARSGEESRIEGLEAGADDYLIKPFSTRELLAHVEANLKMAQIRREAARQEQALRLAAEKAQQEAEATAQRLIQTLEAMSDCFVALDQDWRIVYQNAASEQLNGKPRTEIFGKTHWEEWPASVGSNLEYQYRRAMQEQIPVHFEHHYYDPPNYDVWLEVHAYPFPDGLRIFFRDITERKQAEEVLRESEERYRTLFESIDEGFGVIEMLFDENNRPFDYRFLEINPQFEKHTGLQQALGKTARQLLPNLEEHWLEIYGKVALTGESLRFENRCEVTKRWFDMYAFRVGQPESRKVALVFKDITQRKQAEIALVQLNAELEQRVQERTVQLRAVNAMLLETVREQQQTQLILLEQAQLLDLAHDTIMTRDLNDVITFWNQGAERMYGWSKADALGLHVHRFLETQFPKPLYEIESQLRERGYWEGELIHTRRDGSMITVASRWVMQKDEMGRPIKVLEINNDISDRQRAEVERQRAEEALQQSHTQLLQYTEELETINQDLQHTLEELQATQEELRASNYQLEATILAANEQRQRYEDLFNFAPDGYLVTDTYGAIQEANQAASNLLCVRQSALVGKVLALYICQQDKRRFRTYLNQLQQLYNQQTYELTIQPRQGSPFPAVLTVSTIRDRQGQRMGIRWLIKDITSQKQGEAALQQHMREIEDLYNQAPCGYHSLNAEGTYIRINETELNWLGYTRDEVLHKNFSDFVTAESNSVFQENFPQFKQRGWVKDLEFEMLRKDGTTLWVSLSATAVKDENGNFLMSRSSMFDISDRKRAEAALRESEEKFRQLAENIQAVFWITDIHTQQVFYVSPAYETIWQRSCESLYQNISTWFDSIAPDDHQQLEAALFEQTRTGKYDIQYRIFRPDGSIRWIRDRAFPIKNQAGEMIRVAGIAEDITERQKIEQMKNEFIGIVSHELRTPLTALKMSLGLLKTGIYDKKPDKFQRMLEIAVIDTNRLANLVNDILDLERLESGRTVLEKTRCQVADLMQQAVSGVQPLATPQNITLAISPIEAEVWAAADAIIQTLTNLLSNAIKFSPANSTITLSADRQTDCVLLRVSDRGRGIPADKLETIFGRFQQVDASDSRDKGGTGLGLAICHSIIEQHGGKIWVESTLCEGSTFFFTLPLPPEEMYDSPTDSSCR